MTSQLKKHPKKAHKSGSPVTISYKYIRYYAYLFNSLTYI